MRLLLWGLPILIGFLFGYFLALPVNIILTVIAIGFATWSVWATRNHEIGSLAGIVVAIEAGIFLAALWVTIAIISGFVIHVDLSWLLRPMK